jgi:hypothetical protein
MRHGWIQDVLRQPIDRISTVHGHAEWSPTHGTTVRGRARLDLCSTGDRYVIGVSISRLCRMRMRGLFDAPDITVQSRSDAHLDLVVVTGARHAVSLLHIDSVDCEQIAVFLGR